MAAQGIDGLPDEQSLMRDESSVILDQKDVQIDSIPDN